MVIARKSLPSKTHTGEFSFQPLQTAWGSAGYNRPTKVHVVWSARGL